MKYSIFLLLIAFVALSSCNQKEIPTIDIESAMLETEEILLSELASDIEYIKLERTPASQIMANDNGQIIVGNNIILYKSKKSQRVLVFDRNGKFLNPIAFVGRNPEDFNKLASGILDINPSEKLVLLLDYRKATRENLLKLYSIDGSLVKSRRMLGSQYEGIFFLSDDRLITVRNLRRFPQKEYQATVFDLDLNPIDSLLYLDSVDLEIASDWYYKSLVNKSIEAIYLRKPGVDTIFTLEKNNELKPSFNINFGKLKAPNRRLEEQELNKYLFLEAISTAGDYFFINLFGKTSGYDSVNNPYDNDIIVFNRKTGKSFNLKNHLAPPNRKGGDSIQAPQIVNDLDPLGPIGNLSSYQEYNKILKNNKITSLLKLTSIKERLNNYSKSNTPLKTQKYLNELIELVETNEIEDNPFLRIIHFDKNKHRKGKENSLFRENNNKLESGKMVNLMDGWELTKPGPAGSSGLTIDPTDGTIWIMAFFQNYVFHYSTSGKDLNDGFRVDSLKGEGIAYDPTDNTFWIIDVKGDDVEHFTKLGVNLKDGFPVGNHGAQNGMGIAYDTFDSTLWIVDSRKLFVFHFDKLGNLLDDGFSIKEFGALRPAGIFSDSRDNTLWVVDDPAYVYHFNRKGELLDDSFRLGDVAPTVNIAEGIAFDPITQTFWILGLFDDQMHHIGYK